MRNTLLTLLFILFVSNGMAQYETQIDKHDTTYYRYENGFMISCNKDKDEGYEVKDDYNSSLHMHTVR